MIFRVNVRLGEYDLTTNIDCIKNDCADPVQNIGVEEKIPHPGFNDKNPNKSNDIGLVRLSEEVSYSDFVKPICLPSIVGASRSETMATLQVSGWGRTLNSVWYSSIIHMNLDNLNHFYQKVD